VSQEHICWTNKFVASHRN